MAHTALYGGTVYEKKGGADLVGGTVYKKDHGKVLVGGTAYEVGFFKPMVTVQLTGTGYSSYATAHINGVTYSTGQDEVLQVPVGTSISLSVKDKSEKGTIAKITHTKNGVSIPTGVKGAGSYEFTVEGNIVIKFGYDETRDNQNKKVYSGTIAVTETTEE